MKINEIHKQNLNFIDKFDLFEGQVLRLICDYKDFKKGEKFTISHIHSLYGWILFKETEMLPQEVNELLKITDIKYNLGCGRQFKNIGNRHIEVLGNPDFICGVANAWGIEALCVGCNIKDKMKGGLKNDN